MGDPGEQDARQQSHHKANGHGHHYIHGVLADGSHQLGAVVLEEGPQSLHHLASPQRFSATERATLVLVTMPAMVSSSLRTTT